MARYTGPVCRLCRRAGMKLRIAAKIYPEERAYFTDTRTVCGISGI